MITELQNALASARRVFAFLEEEEETADPQPSLPVENIDGSVYFAHVHFGYVPEKTIINDFSAIIQPGQKVAIVGPTGAGKTTMMKAELGLIPTAHGSIKVLGQPAGSANRRIGYVPQSYASDIESNITAEQSVLLGLTGTRFGIHPVTKTLREKARKAMDFVELQDKANYRLSELSGGLRQRVAIAQALVDDPKLLMLDEPLANILWPLQYH